MMNDPALQCPIPSSDNDHRITLAHGEGGRAMRELVRGSILGWLGCEERSLDDSVELLSHSAASAATPLRWTTDSYVISPLFFPGGDIGRLAVLGTVNDLAVGGAKGMELSLALILEEGLPLSTLQRVVESIAQAARETGVRIVTGDTKVVPCGAADQLFITTSGIGISLPWTIPGPCGITVGDVLLVSGPIGQHGVAVMAARDDLGFVPPPTSDCASLWPAVAALHEAGITPRAMRDATRGGVAAVLHEWSAACGRTMRIGEQSLPIRDEVAGVCELLGLDPLHVANEGTMVIAVPPADAQRALLALRRTTVGREATIIGAVTVRAGGPVVLEPTIGRLRVVDEPAGAPLPRIC